MEKFACKQRDNPANINLRSENVRDSMGSSILVVDDELNFLTLLRWFLSQRGYTVATASSAEEALSLVEGQSFEVALLDIKLGSTDGIALLETLIDRVPQIKVIMMTAYPTMGSIKSAFDKGASRYLTKPVNVLELVELIRRLLGTAA